MYRHTQFAPVFWFAAPVGCLLMALPFIVPMPPGANFVVWTAAIAQAAAFWFFSALTTEDEGDALAVWFGRIRLFVTRIPYEQVIDCSADRSRWWEGWGLHYTFNGWLYNIWGYDCVRITFHGRSTKTIRIGTDDVPGLLALLHARTSSYRGGNQDDTLE